MSSLPSSPAAWPDPNPPPAEPPRPVESIWPRLLSWLYVALVVALTLGFIFRIAFSVLYGSHLDAPPQFAAVLDGRLVPC
jgi:hypothetical protein